jgi:glycosyltransferase involved in cell wall biosynthesis
MVDTNPLSPDLKHSILFISRLFPPIGGSGVQRIVKTIKYFNRTDYRIFVLTTDRTKEGTWPSDPSLLNEVSPVQIVRTKTGELSDQAPMWLRKIVGLIFLPDIYALWAFRALPAAIRLIRKERIRHIYASGPPFVNLMIGALVKRFTSAKLILEYRDGWTLNPYHPINVAPWYLRLQRKVIQLMERTILGRADHVIYVTSGTMQLYCSTFPKVLTPAQVSVVYNGYDPDDFTDNITATQDKCIFTYVGMFFPFRRPDNFLRGLARVIQADPTVSNSIVVRFVGGFISAEIEHEVRECINKLGLEKNMEYVGNVSHKKSVEYLRQSTINLFITGNVPGGEHVVAGKTFEYLAAKRPVLALTYSNGEAGNMFLRSGLGVIVDDTNETELAKVISAMVNDWRNHKLPSCNMDQVEAYAKPKLVEAIAHTLDSIK